MKQHVVLVSDAFRSFKQKHLFAPPVLKSFHPLLPQRRTCAPRTKSWKLCRRSWPRCAAPRRPRCCRRGPRATATATQRARGEGRRGWRIRRMRRNRGSAAAANPLGISQEGGHRWSMIDQDMMIYDLRKMNRVISNSTTKKNQITDVFFPTKLCGVLVFRSAPPAPHPPSPPLRVLTYIHTQPSHAQPLCHTHTIFTHITFSHTTFSHTTLSHTNCHTHNFVKYTTLSHTQLCHTELCHIELCHTQLCYTTLPHTTVSHTTLSHTTSSHTHTTWSHTHTTLSHNFHTHTQLCHTQPSDTWLCPRRGFAW